MKARILVIEDEMSINDLLCMNLEIAGYETVGYLDGNEAYEAIIQDHAFQCALVDIMLPGRDGYSLLPKLKQYEIPVIFLTAKGDIASKIKGLKDGAEDYIVKPFEMLEVMVRLEKVLERNGTVQEQIQIGDVIIDTASRTVTKMGMEIYLKPMEYNCLMVFAKNPNKALTRNQILQELWNEEFCGETRTVDAHVGRIRKNLAGRIRLKQFPESVTDLRWIYETLNKDLFQTTCIILLASSGIFLYTTYCWKNQSIQNINSYESSIFRTNILQFENKTSLSDNQKQNADNEMRPQIVTYAFRQVFHDSAVLYLDGKMTYNGTVYEFDVKKLRELCASKANMVDHGSNSDGHGPMISQINGRTLLLFYYGNVNMGYQIVTYKDITDVIEKSHLLFFRRVDLLYL